MLGEGFGGLRPSWGAGLPCGRYPGNTGRGGMNGTGADNSTRHGLSTFHIPPCSRLFQSPVILYAEQPCDIGIATSILQFQTLSLGEVGKEGAVGIR